MTHYHEQRQQHIMKEARRMKPQVNFELVRTQASGRQRVYKCDGPMTKKANGKVYSNEPQKIKVYANKEKTEIKTILLGPEFSFVVVSDAHTHTERLVFPCWEFEPVINDNPYLHLCDTIAGVNTFMIHGGDDSAVKPDAVYLRMLAKANGYQMNRKIIGRCEHENLKDKILDWMIDGEVGQSSEFMAFACIGINKNYGSYPYDPSDLNRCILLVERIPEIKESFGVIASQNKYWYAIINNWDFLVDLFHSEVGKNWSKGQSAPLTYSEMKRLFENA